MIRPGSSVKRKEQTKATAPQAKHKVRYSLYKGRAIA